MEYTPITVEIKFSDDVRRFVEVRGHECADLGGVAHVHCGQCGREATDDGHMRYRCHACGCVGSRDDRGLCGTIRWG